jgi:hypothetical protein
MEHQVRLSKLAGSQNLMRRQVKVGGNRAAGRAFLTLVAQEHILARPFLDLAGEVGSKRNSH